MKNRKILFLLPFLFLTGCGKSKDFEEKIAPICDHLKMAGTISYKFYDENDQPTESEPVTSAVQVLFTETGHEISYKGNFDQDFVETLFKSEDNTVELRYINNMNELVVERPKDDNDNEYDFESYTNPFKLLNSENMIIAENQMSAVLDLTNAFDTAKDFVGRLTHYTFPELAEVRIDADKEIVTGVHIETTILKETLRSGVYSFDLNVEAYGETVTGPITPEPAQPNDKQVLLQTALQELMEQDYEATLTVDLGYGMIYRFGLYKNSNGLLCTDKDEPLYSIGYFKEQENFYEVTYDRTNATFVKKVSTGLTDEDILPAWLLFSTVLYEPSDDSKSFTLSSTVSESYAGQFGYLLTLGNCMEMLGATGMTMSLDEQNHLSSVSFESGHEMFTSAVLTIDSLGTCTMPFELSTLPDKE